MGTERISGSGLNKTSDLQSSRKPLGITNHFGELELQILWYSIYVSRRFSASDIVTYFFRNVAGEERTRLLKRVHDAIYRLRKRGILARVARGLYERIVDIDPSLLKTIKPNARASIPRKAPELKETKSALRGGCDVARVHGVSRDPLVLYRDLYFARRLLELAIRVLEEELLGMGYSKYRLREVRRSAEVLVVRVFRGRAVFGVHGFWARRKLVKARFSPLDLGLTYGYAREMGVDFVLDESSLPKIHVKVYTARGLGYAVMVHRSLDSYAVPVRVVA